MTSGEGPRATILPFSMPIAESWRMVLPGPPVTIVVFLITVAVITVSMSVIQSAVLRGNASGPGQAIIPLHKP